MAAGRLFHTQQPTKNMRKWQTMERIGDGTMGERGGGGIPLFRGK